MMADMNEASKTLPQLKVNLTRLLLTKGLFDSPRKKRDEDNEGDRSSADRGSKMESDEGKQAADVTSSPSQASATADVIPKQVPPRDQEPSNEISLSDKDKVAEQRRTTLSRLMVTKGLFDNSTNRNDVQQVLQVVDNKASASKAQSGSTSRSSVDANQLQQTQEKQTDVVQEQSVETVKRLDAERESSVEKSTIHATTDAPVSKTTVRHRSPIATPQQKSSVPPNLEDVAQKLALKVTTNFKIPKKYKSTTERESGVEAGVGSSRRRELEGRREQRRRDITAVEWSRKHRNNRRQEDAGMSGHAMESSKSPPDVKDTQNVFDLTEKRSRNLNSSRNRPKRWTDRDDTGCDLEDVVLVDPVIVSKLDVAQCGTSTAVAGVRLVEQWLHTNPVGERSNAGGEVYVKPSFASRKGSNVKGQMATTSAASKSSAIDAINVQFAGRNLNKLTDEEPMVIDKEEFVAEVQQFRRHIDYDQSRMICGQLTQLRSQMREEAMSVDGDRNATQQHHQQKKRRTNIYVVCDTNVLLSDLYMVDELMRGRPFRGEDAAKIVLVIPWVVLQELDGLKNDRRDTPNVVKLREVASKAVRYLHDLFTNAHPQVRGQTSRESVADVGLTVECNDDKILQCCLLFRKKGVGKVVLFSNDRNLCSKTIVHKIVASTKDGIKGALDKLDPIPSTVAGRQALPEVSEEVSRERILRAYRTMFLGVLGDIVKHEMQEIYGEMWLKVVLIRPPWVNVLDVLKCLDKHWIAVFGHVVQRRAKVHLDLVFQKMKALSGQPNHDELKFLFVESLKLLSYFDARVAVAGRAKQGIQSIREFLKELTAARQGATGDGGGGFGAARGAEPLCAVNAQQAGPSAAVDDQMIQPSSQPGAIDEVSTPVSQPIPVDPLVVVYSVFQRVWSSINHICGSIYDSFGLPNPISYVRPPILPSPVDCYHFISRFYPAITEIRDLVRRIMRMPMNVSAEEVEFSKLCHRLLNYFSVLGIGSDHNVFVEPMSPEMLHFFCTTYEKREMLSRGLIQLEECCAYIFRVILTIKDWGVD